MVITVKDIEEKNKETFEEVKKPILKKLTPEELIQRRTQLEEFELNMLDKQRLVEILEREIKDELPMRRKRLQLRQERNNLANLEFDLKTIKKLIKESERA